MNNTRITFTAVTFLLLNACSMSNMVVTGSLSVMDGGVEAMNRETDLELARTAIPANLKLVEGLIIEAPQNLDLRINAAQGFYGYAYGFVEDEIGRKVPKWPCLNPRRFRGSSWRFP